MASNQGSETIDQVFEDIMAADGSLGVLAEAGRIAMREARNHPAESTCECAAIEALCVLYERGYRLVKE
jgi:hypothetical protein